VKTWLGNIASEMYDFTRSLFPSWGWGNSIRHWGRQVGLRFWPSAQPLAHQTTVNYALTRSIYRNEGDSCLGTGFAKPIIDLQVGFVGIPIANTDDENINNFLNECLGNYWINEIQQIIRDTTRDSKSIVRLSRPDVLDPLMTLEEAEHGSLEIIPPERVDIERNQRNKRIIERAVIRHRVLMVKDKGSISQGRDPVTEEHDVLEYITRDRYSFFDQTTSEWLDELASDNTWNFVPLLEVYNEYDAALEGGMSDLETPLPFMRAFSEVLGQGLQAHKYHSTPKVVMSLSDVAPFIKNNFPEAVNPETGEIMPYAEISWRGREILFLQTGDSMEFLEATSVLGDTTILLEFLIDCICIASQTPEWAFMRVSSGTANSDRNAQTVPFLKKIDRKRRDFTKPFQELLKMVMVANGFIPVRAELSWEIVRPDDLVVMTQAFQQLVMGLEVAVARGEISDETYRRMIKQFLPAMKTTQQEEKDSLNNRELPAPVQPIQQPERFQDEKAVTGAR
jgi:hypothetical protein